MIKPNWNPGTRELRQFSGTLFCASLIWGGILTWRHGFNNVALWSWITGTLLGLLGLHLPRSQRLLYVLLTAIALPIGLVIGNLLMAVIYFGVVTPIAIVFKLVGRNSLNRRPDATATTYWTRRPPAPPTSKYFNQF